MVANTKVTQLTPCATVLQTGTRDFVLGIAIQNWDAQFQVLRPQMKHHSVENSILELWPLMIVNTVIVEELTKLL